MIDNRLILKLAAFDVFALFAAWYQAQWEFVKQLIDQAWAQQLHLSALHDRVPLDVLHPLLIVIAACLLAALYLLNLRRHRRGRYGANMRRFQEANAHAHAIDRRIASTKVMFELPERRKDPARGSEHEPLSWRPPPSLRPEQAK
jgi:hypothetical protein